MNDAEKKLADTTEQALWHAAVLRDAVGYDSPSGKIARHFREELLEFEDKRRKAEDIRSKRLGFGDENTENVLDTLLDEIAEQKHELLMVLNKIPSIAPADESERSKEKSRAATSLKALRELRAALQ